MLRQLLLLLQSLVMIALLSQAACDMVKASCAGHYQAPNACVVLGKGVACSSLVLGTSAWNVCLNYSLEEKGPMQSKPNHAKLRSPTQVKTKAPRGKTKGRVLLLVLLLCPPVCLNALTDAVTYCHEGA